MSGSSYPFRRAHGRQCCWELARYLRAVPLDDVRELVEDVAIVLQSGVSATDLRGGLS